MSEITVIIRELLICMMDGFCDNETANYAPSPRQLSSGPCVLLNWEDWRMTNLTHAHTPHMNEIGFPTILESAVMQIKSSLFILTCTIKVYKETVLIFFFSNSMFAWNTCKKSQQSLLTDLSCSKLAAGSNAWTLAWVILIFPVYANSTNELSAASSTDFISISSFSLSHKLPVNIALK